MGTFDDQHALETYKSLIAISTEAFKALQLLNGGAVVALLTYLGHLDTSSKVADSVALPVGLFVAGLVARTLAFASAYFTQLALFNESVENTDYWAPSHPSMLWVTLGIAILSLLAFGWGSFAAIAVLTQR
jgi:hypothetical protein